MTLCNDFYLLFNLQMAIPDLQHGTGFRWCGPQRCLGCGVPLNAIGRAGLVTTVRMLSIKNGKTHSATCMDPLVTVQVRTWLLDILSINQISAEILENTVEILLSASDKSYRERFYYTFHSPGHCNYQLALRDILTTNLASVE